MGRAKPCSLVVSLLLAPAFSLRTTMLDVITLFTAVNIQSELEQANVEKGENVQALVITEQDSGREGSAIEGAAEQLSSAFDAFEGALASGVCSIFGGAVAGSPTPKPLTKK